MQPERRVRRSSTPAEALELYLNALAERTNARAIAVADPDGLLVGGVGAGDLEVLAALGADAAPDAKVHDATLDCGGMPLRLYAIDGKKPPLRETAQAVTRILAA